MKVLIWLAFTIGTPMILFGQEDIISIVRTSDNIILDGKLQESFWKSSSQFNDFTQLRPELGQAATESSQAYLCYNDNFLFFAVEVKYQEPSQLFSRVMERDVNLANDDYVALHLDTYNDHTNSLIFRTNALGARFDLENNRNGQNLNTSWNTFWNVATSMTEEGWIAEFKIPLSSLRFEESTLNRMRFKVAVNYKEKNELIVYPLIDTEISDALYQSNNAQVIEFENLQATKALYIAPYVKGSLKRESILSDTESAHGYETEVFDRKQYTDEDLTDKVLSNIGGDLKWKPNSNNTLDVTLNTDFAQIESDDRVINLSRFSIALPEKRLFFLENADLFNSNMFDHRLFQSRRIGIFRGNETPLIGGVRYVSNKEKLQIGALSLQTHKSDEFNLASYTNSVIRVKHRVGSLGSYIGLMNTSKLAKGDYNSLLAADGNIRFKNNLDMGFVFGSSFDKVKGNFKPLYGLSFTRFRPNGFGFQYRFREYTEDFDPGLGFVSQPNTKRVTSNNSIRKNYTNHSFLQLIYIGHYIRKNWISSTGDHGFFMTNLYFGARNKKGYTLQFYAPLYKEDFIYNDWQFTEHITIPSKKYSMWVVEPSISNGSSYRYQYSFATEIAQFYGGKQLTFSADLNYDLSQNFKFEVGANYNKLEFPDSFSDNGNSTVYLNTYFARFKVAFSSKAFVNLYTQYDTSSENLGFNLRYRYQPTEGTDLYIVYNHNVNTDIKSESPRLNSTRDQSIIIKFSKTLIF